MKYLNFLLGLLFIIFFIPTIYLITKAVDKYGDKTKTAENLTLYSFGAFLKYMDPNNLVVFEERQDYILGYCFVLFFGIMVTMVFMFGIKK
jgi:hypothetical protein